MNYRSDIDGLRAIAVISVVLFHANPIWCPGGYVGVDVFFVISGFLITTIIQREITEEKFSLLTFYTRRFRRILPAFFVVIMASITAGYFLLFPQDYRDFGASVIAASTSMANILFWRESGYFANASDLKPLLHTWSLSIEEQFYIFFPLLLMFLHKFARKYIFHIVLTLSLVSFSVCVIGTLIQPAASFFLLPTRAWELSFGALLALLFLRNQKIQKLDPLTLNIFAGVGIGLVVLAFVGYDKESSFPGWRAIVPCIGTGLIIVSNKSFVSRVLSFPPITFVGKISYSWYLWHWPIFVFMRHSWIEEPNNYDMIFACAVSLILATLSWKFIEQPFRANKNGPAISSKKSIVIGLSFIFIFSLIGGVICFYSGFPKRFDRHVVELTIKDEYPFGEVDLFDQVPIGGANVSPRFALWGDSHAMAISGSIAELAKAHNESCKMYTASVHPPILGVKHKSNKAYEAAAHVFEEIVSDDNIEVVILHSMWIGYYVPSDVEGSSAYQALLHTVNLLIENRKKVVLVYPIPTHSYDPKIMISKMARDNIDYKSVSDQYLYREENKDSLEMLDSIPDHPDLIRIYPHELLVKNGGKIITTNEGIVLYRDAAHLSEKGSAYIMPLFNHIFNITGDDKK